jgi:IS1 family transposase
VWPRGKAPKDTKNGPLHHGQPHPDGHDGGRPFVQGCEPSRRSADTRALIARVRVERRSWRGIGRAVGVSLNWCLGVVVPGVAALPDQLHGPPVTGHGHVMRRRLEGAAEDLRSFVPQQATTPWSWLAMDATSRPVMALPVGDRRRTRAQRWWAQRPAASRQPAPVATEPYAVSAGVMPAALHRALSQLARTTHPIERFHTTRRQRVSGVVREALSCAKNLAHHRRAMKRFICHDNLTKASA